MNDIYQSPQSQLDTAISQPVYAGFWIRVLASIIDSILISLVIVPLSWSVYGSNYFFSDKLVLGYADIFISYVLPFVAVMMFWIYKSATLGKIILGLKIVDSTTYQPTTPGKLIIRYVAYYPSLLILCLGFLWVAWDKKKQGWHDKLAQTIVVKI